MVNVNGKVVNYWTNQPVSDITVMFNDKMGTTDVNGNFTIRNLPAAMYTITVIHRDYERQVVTLDLRTPIADDLNLVESIRIKPIFKAL